MVVLDHAWQKLLDEKNGGHNVDSENALQSVLGKIHERDAVSDPGIVDEHGRVTMLVADPLSDRRDVGWIVKVGLV